MAEPERDPQAKLQALVERMVTGTTSPYHVPALLVAGRSLDGRRYAVSCGTDSEGQSITESSLFPTTCVTKIVMVYAVLSLVRDGSLDLDMPISTWLPDLPARTRPLKLRGLLSHSAGMGPDLGDLYGPDLTWEAIKSACLSSEPLYPPGTVRYSNIGFGLVAAVVEAVMRVPIELAYQQLVLRVLEMDACFTLEAPRTQIRIEEIRSVHAGTAMEPFNSAFWRRLRLPWAGLSMTADALFRLASPFLSAWRSGPGAHFLWPATQNQAGFEPGGFAPEWRRLGFASGGAIWWPQCPWGLGLEVRGPKWPHWTPRSASPLSFGMLGSSGCLLWTEPERGVTWVILGARATDGGWMLRYGPRLGEAILDCFK